MSHKVNPENSSIQPINEQQDDQDDLVEDFSAYALRLLETTNWKEEPFEFIYDDSQPAFDWDEEGFHFGGSVTDQEDPARSPSPLENHEDMGATASAVTPPVIEKTKGLFGKIFGWMTGASSTKQPSPIEDDWTEMTKEHVPVVDWSNQNLRYISKERISTLMCAGPETLDLSNNFITHLTTHFWDITSLRTLDLSNNPLSLIAGHNHLKKTSSLKTLLLNRTCLKHFPDELTKLPGLTHLEFERFVPSDQNPFPKNFNQLSNLEFLNICYHEKGRPNLPPLDSFTNLKHLNIVGNTCSEVSWGKLINLETVVLDSLQFEIYSDSIRKAIPGCKIIIKDTMHTHKD